MADTTSPSTKAAPSQSAQARAWIMEQPLGSLFWLDDVPAARPLASQVLSRLCRSGGDQPPIRRLANGFYLRVRYTKNGRPWPVDCDLVGLVHAGPGAGFADISAVNRMGWSLQIPAQTHIATLLRTAPVDGRVRYHFRPRHERRMRLSYAEVTVIEAVRHFYFAKVSWDDAVGSAAGGTSSSRLSYPSVIRSEAIRWAASSENPRQLDPYGTDDVPFIDKIHDLCDRVPAVQRTGDHG